MTDNKYTNGKIYKITDTSYSECYVGSTIETLSRRIARHRYEYKRFINNNRQGGFVRVFKLFDNYGFENCKIELLELCPCNSVMELRRREGHFIRTLECVNKFIAGRTMQEWRSENQEHIKQYNIQTKDNRIQYYIQNKTKLNEQHKHYRHENEDALKEQKKLYRHANKDTIKEQRIQNYIQNKDKINEKRRQQRNLNKNKLNSDQIEHQEGNTNNTNNTNNLSTLL
jgi:hypothetical protein